MKKYKLGESKDFNGIKLFRIIALKDFSNVRKGDAGGWIESEENLPQNGNCWVSGDVWVSGDARVFGDAQISGKAKVSGNVKVFGDAQISDKAKVYGNARVSGDAWVSGGAWRKTPLMIYGTRDVVCHSALHEITIGCISKTFDEWLEKYIEIGKKNEYSKDEIKEYKKYIDLIIFFVSE